MEVQYIEQIDIAEKCVGGPGQGSCCTDAEPYEVGGGDCDNDFQCTGGYVCGSDNCKDYHDEALQHADCCTGNATFTRNLTG